MEQETPEQMAAKILFDDAPIEMPQLPSNLQVNQVAKLQFRSSDEPFICTVRCVHFYASKVKYDLGLWLGDRSVDNPETETRIYNVDSAFVTPA